MKLRPPELLGVHHDLAGFDCGSLPLNIFLQKYALQNNAAGIAKTYVVTETIDSKVRGYYSIAAGSVEVSTTPERVRKGIPRHPVPVVLLARLAVHRDFQRLGLGKALLKDALLRSANVSRELGIRAVLVHAQDPKAAEFYSRFGFVSSPSDPLHMLLLMKDVANILK